ncbi:hypothetical protein EYF80_059726 [Liparis tanakae]|uniref:Uncharacterized protein n=1 Tax=Liparis tanakae TaxID=230148 RepID=A0A4Z2ENT7_9TELE|nr:hypothetical protein EYF80_059726 [Liparis tanakae]
MEPTAKTRKQNAGVYAAEPGGRANGNTGGGLATRRQPGPRQNRLKDVYSLPGRNSNPKEKGVKSWNFSENLSGPLGDSGRLHSQRLKPLAVWSHEE